MSLSSADLIRFLKKKGMKLGKPVSAIMVPVKKESMILLTQLKNQLQ